jgi:hypothetical protein
VLIEVHIEMQAEILLKASLLVCHPVNIEGHSSLNSSREGVTTDSLDGISDEVIEPCFASHCVSKDYRLVM